MLKTLIKGSGIFHLKRTVITLTVPEGFTTLAACMNGASGTNVLPQVSALPQIVSCVGGGRFAQFTLATLLEEEKMYALSLTVVNPPSSYPYSPGEARCMLHVDLE